MWKAEKGLDMTLCEDKCLSENFNFMTEAKHSVSDLTEDHKY